MVGPRLQFQKKHSNERHDRDAVSVGVVVHNAVFGNGRDV
jgi:hypothetical protein